MVVVDVQKDFTTAYSGSLAVNGTDDAFLKSVAEATKKLKELGLPIYATMDWHPAGHVSFASRHSGKKVLESVSIEDGRTQILWPDHCVQGTDGATLLLNEKYITGIIRKGEDVDYDSYSGFQDEVPLMQNKSLGGRCSGQTPRLDRPGATRQCQTDFFV
ncbi:hypothetical protein [Desulfobacula sp.]|uniref:hypothetical protein n=1 Tax=Desulfobacula sp. TaxID=2593537 RepID=UPI00261D0918|nr:hypothetical protein [Desulfobacula sp.]